MKSPAFLIFFFVFGCLLNTPQESAAYDAPDFDYPLFSADGIFLEPSDEESLLQALSSLASNFGDDAKIDDDLKEKAIAIALRLDPLHYSSRMAHRALWEGSPTTPVPYFTTLSSISEVLWTTATMLQSAPREPEELKLAPYLMDLSLAIHASPTKERLLAFAEATPAKKLAWEKFLILDPSTSSSSAKGERRILQAHAAAEAEAEAAKAKEAKATTQEPPAMKPEETDPPEPSAAFTATLKKLPAVLHVAAVETMPVPGEYSLMMRPPDGPVERDLFPNLVRVPPAEYEELPLFSGRRSLTISNLDVSGTFPESRGMSFPARVIGEIQFEEKGSLPGPRRISLASGRLPALILVEATIKDLSINPAFTLSGDVVSPKSTALVESSLLQTVTAGAELGTKFLLFPESGLDDLVGELQESPDQLQSLFDTEIISYNNYEDALTLLTSEPPAALQTASEAFAEIKEASTRMALIDFAANTKVQERLEALLGNYPGHLSALALLEFGRRPLSKQSQIKRDLGSIKAAVEPFLILKFVDATDYEALKRQLEPADIALSRLRNSVIPEVRDYFGYAEDVIETTELYLGLTNKTSSIGRQRQEQVQESIEKLEAEETKLLGEEE